MRIPISYLFAGLIFIIGIFILKSSMNNIANQAKLYQEKQNLIQLDNFKKSVEKMTDTQKAASYGWKLMKRNQIDQSIILFDKAHRLDPNFRDAAVYLGYCRLKKIEQSGTNLSVEQQHIQLNSAKDTLMKAYQIDPLFPLTNKLLSEIAFYENNDKDKELWYARVKAIQ